MKGVYVNVDGDVDINAMADVHDCMRIDVNVDVGVNVKVDGGLGDGRWMDCGWWLVEFDANVNVYGNLDVGVL